MPIHAMPKPPCSTGDAARLAQELSGIADADDRRIDAAQHRVNAAQPRDLLFLQLALGDVDRDRADHRPPGGPRPGIGKWCDSHHFALPLRSGPRDARDRLVVLQHRSRGRPSIARCIEAGTAS